MGTKKFMKNYGWGCIGRTLVQLIPLILVVLINIIRIFTYGEVVNDLHTALFHIGDESALEVFIIVMILYVIGVLIFNFFGGIIWGTEWTECFGWWVKPFGKVNDGLYNIGRKKGKSRYRKAKRIYAYCCLFKYILVFALFLPDIESHVVDSLVLTLFFFVYYFIVDIVIGIISARNTCPVCGSSQISTHWGDSWYSTEKFVEHDDERIGTVRIGETKVGIYQEKSTVYETTTEHRSGYRICAVCGHSMGDVKEKRSYTT